MEVKKSVGGPRSSAFNTASTWSNGMGGTWSCSLDSSAINGGGSRSERVERSWPNLTKVGPSSSKARRNRSGADEQGNLLLRLAHFAEGQPQRTGQRQAFRQVFVAVFEKDADDGAEAMHMLHRPAKSSKATQKHPGYCP